MMNAVTRAAVRARALSRCEYCLVSEASIDLSVFHVEHVIAYQHGGGDEISNLAWACARCNHYKGPNIASIDPDSGQLVALFNPRKDSWPDHFELRNTFIVGLTPVGRVTARLLEMNAESRRLLRAEPPEFTS